MRAVSSNREPLIPPEETASALCQLFRELGDGLRIFGGDLHVRAELGNAGGEFFAILDRLHKTQIHEIEAYADHGQRMLAPGLGAPVHNIAGVVTIVGGVGAAGGDRSQRFIQRKQQQPLQRRLRQSGIDQRVTLGCDLGLQPLQQYLLAVRRGRGLLVMRGQRLVER